MTDQANTDWLDSRTVIDHLEGQGSFSQIGSNPLETWLRTGTITTRAAKAIIGFPSGKKEETDYIVPPTIWDQIVRSIGASKSWREGAFFVERQPWDSSGRESVALTGVVYNKAEVNACVPLNLKPKSALERLGVPKLEVPNLGTVDALAPPEPAKKRGGGRRRDVDGWTSFWWAVLQLSQEKRLTTGHFSTQKELRGEILEMISEALSDDTIEDTVRQVWHKYVEPSDR